jgi:hypothetical protein
MLALQVKLFYPPPSSATDFPGIFYAQNNNNNKESKNGINVASPAHCTGGFGYKPLLTWHRKMRFWPAPFYTGCERALQMPLHSPTPTLDLGRFYTGIIIYYLFFIIFRGCPLSQRPK